MNAILSLSMLKNYINLIRFHNPIGAYLLFLPCLWGILLANKNYDIQVIFLAKIILLFAIGSLIMRSAGCIINDFFDIKFDKKVNRTQNRPLASGQISKNQALIFCLALFFLGFLILISLNKTTILIGLISVPLIIIYPLAKRFTNYPQIFLGIVFNLGIIMGYTSISNNFDQQIILFYIVGVILTFLYDTIYAYQDIDDDLKVGIKSSAIKIGKNKQILYFLALIIFILTITAGKLFFLTNIYHFIAFLGFLWLIYVIYSLDFTSKQNVAAKFKQNCYFIILINIAILASN